jgi:uncharacterized protein YndB with AHSA1/START domain
LSACGGECRFDAAPFDYSRPVTPKRKENDADHTIRLHRVLRGKPEKVYRAFLDADALAEWLPPHGFTCKVHELDARVGGRQRMSFTNFTTGQTHAFGGTYL